MKQEAKAGFGQPEKNNTPAGLLCKATSGKTGLLTKSNWEKLLHVSEWNGEPKII